MCSSLRWPNPTKKAFISVSAWQQRLRILWFLKTNNVLVLEENLHHSLNWSNYIPRKGNRRDRKMCCTFSEIPTKQLIRFRISFDGSWCVLANSFYLKWDCAWLFQSHIIHLLHWQREICVPFTVLVLRVRRWFHCCFCTPCFSGWWEQRAWCPQPLTLGQPGCRMGMHFDHKREYGFILLYAYCINCYGLVFYFRFTSEYFCINYFLKFNS